MKVVLISQLEAAARKVTALYYDGYSTAKDRSDAIDDLRDALAALDAARKEGTK